MKLSTYISKLKEKNVPKDDALAKCKLKAKLIGTRWTTKQQALFESLWGTKSSVKKIVKPLDLDQDDGQGGDAAQRLTFFKHVLKQSNFDKSCWNKYGLHVIVGGSEKRPVSIKKAITVLEQCGFEKQHRSPMSADNADRNAQRAITWYKDKYGNTANTISQKSDNGKSDFYILNIVLKLSQSDRNKLSDIEKQIDEKYQAALERVQQGKLKGKKEKTEPWQLTFADYLKQMKTNPARKFELKNDNSKEWLHDQHEQLVRRALKEDKKVPAEVLKEYKLDTTKSKRPNALLNKLRAKK